MQIVTLAILFRGDKILLAKKKRGFGVHKWNGYGGKLEGEETVLENIVREVKEESNLDIPKDKFKEVGIIDFYFDDKPEWNQKAFVYKVENFEGDPEETEEMLPKWFELHEIPYEEMWAGDDKWIPCVLENKYFKCEMHLPGEGEKVTSLVIE